MTIPEDQNFKLLKEIKICNYKTYLNLEIAFKDSITILVGPNECGKTNLLESINFLGNYQKLNKNDTCLFCKNYWNEEPRFIYYLNSKFLDLKDPKSDLILEVKPSKIESSKLPESSSEQTLINIHRLSFPVGGGGHVHVRIPPELQSKFNIPGTITIQEGKHFDIKEFSNKELDQLNEFNKSNPLYNKVTISKIEVPKSSTLDNANYLKDILQNIKIIYWAYDDTKFIQDTVDINSLNQNPKQYKYILNMLKITGIEQSHFLQATDIQRINMISNINSRISDLIKDNWKQYSIDFYLSLGRNNNLITTFRENGQNIEPGKRSEGFKWFFSFLLDFNANFGSDIRNCLILLDEPGIHLHPGGQRMLLKQLEELSKNNQIIYTTHLPFMINRMFPKRIIYLNKVNGITEIKPPRKEGIFDDILLSSTLGYAFTSLSNWGEINIFVEGITDKILLKKIILEKANKDKEILVDLNEFSLIPLNGVKNLESFIRVAEETDAKYIVFLDNDGASKKYTKKYEKRQKNHPTTIDHIIFLDDNKTIEDYIPIDILNNALKKIRLSNTIIYSEFIEEWNFEKESIANQIKKMTQKINKLIEESQSNNELNITKENIIDKITSQDFKLDLILHIKELINSANVDQFKDLIEFIQLITEKAKKIYKI